MNDRETLDAIAKIVSDSMRGVRVHTPAMFAIDRLIEERAAARVGEPSDRDVLLDAADALSGAGNALFNAVGAIPAVRRIWRVEDALRERFGIPSPDAAPATSATKKKE